MQVTAVFGNSKYDETRRLKSRQQAAKPTFVGYMPVGEGRLCLLLVQIYLPPQAKFRIAAAVFVFLVNCSLCIQRQGLYLAQ
ncbi:MAG: hypothetical protein KF770_14220 [Anaerolineae bacterium]|nr:hypothetical protein [Anaerolineae bacterium]